MYAAQLANAYAKVSIETGVITADPLKLVLMLYEGAMLAVSDARRYAESGSIAARGEAISKAIMIIESGLKASLDTSAGGELALQLAELYDYMSHRLLLANLENRPDWLAEVSRLLGELDGAWRELDSDPKRRQRAMVKG